MADGQAGDIQSVTTALQAQEKLYLLMRQNAHDYDETAISKTTEILDSLRELKSKIEGSWMNIQDVCVDQKIMQDEVRPLMLMQTPVTLSDETRRKMRDLVIAAFKGTCRSVEFIGLMSNEWYTAMHSDRGIQAKHNVLLIVHSYKPAQFLPPVRPQANEQNQVLDEGWFTAVEIGHAARFIVRGNVRYMEALYLTDRAIIHQSQAWKDMKEAVLRTNPLSLKTFLEQVKGQAVGQVARKAKKSGRMCLRHSATLYDFSGSFSLLSYMRKALLCIQSSEEDDSLQKEAYAQLQLAYKNSDDEYGSQQTKEELLDTLMKWKCSLDENLGKQFTPPKLTEQETNKHLLKFRCGDVSLKPMDFTGSAEDRESLLALLEQVEGSDALLSKLDPSRVIMVAQAGSALYDLQTPTSDVDYVIIYADAAENTLGSCSKRTECLEKRGPQLSVEYGAYEARIFAEMLWKGSVVMLELAFSEDLAYKSDMWRELVSDKHVFLTEHGILQYFGLIKNNWKMIVSGKYENQPRERKLFYQIFHKLYTLDYFNRGEIPPIKCSGETKDFIMKIRKEPLEGELSRQNLMDLADTQINIMRHKLVSREKRLPENVNGKFLTEWLAKVRGWPLDLNKS